jgi:hypothetical protein
MLKCSKKRGISSSSGGSEIEDDENLCYKCLIPLVTT